jgi:hypothetical protein
MRMSLVPSSAAFTCGLLAGLLLVLGGCDTGPGDSLFDPDHTFAPDPVIASVQPDGAALAGVDVLTITGQNFSTEPARTQVYFDDVRGEVLEVSPTQIRVRAPNLARPAIRLRVMVLGAEHFSNAITYRLDPAAERFASLLPGEEPFGITTDAQGDLLVSMFADGLSAGILRITPTGDRSQYISTPFSWTDLAIGPDGSAYGVRNLRAVFRLPEGGTQQTFQALPAGAALIALEFDSDGALWTASSTGVVYRIADGEAQEFAISGTIRDIALFQNHLYVAVTQNGASRVVRAPITGPGQLGAVEEYAAITATFNTEARRLAFAADGSLLVGTQSAPALILISPGGSAEIFHTGIVTPPVRSMAWGSGTHLFAVARVTGITASRGRDLPDLIRIETRKEGA